MANTQMKKKTTAKKTVKGTVKQVTRKRIAQPPVAELNVERMELTQLKPHPKNPRTHPKPDSPEWEVLRKSLEHDYFDPIIFNKRNGMLVSGHLRTKVLLSLGTTEADVVVVDYDEPTHLARLLASNRSTGADNPGMLTEVLHELGSIEGFNLALTGFGLAEIEDDIGMYDVGFGELPTLPTGERLEFQQCKFVLHDSQRPTVEKALFIAKELGLGDSEVNTHPSSNAITAICDFYVRGNESKLNKVSQAKKKAK